MKINSSIKKRSNTDKIVKRNGVVWIINDASPRNKQRQRIKKAADKLKKRSRKRKASQRKVRSRK
jgi:ribosomal protein L36